MWRCVVKEGWAADGGAGLEVQGVQQGHAVARVHAKASSEDLKDLCPCVSDPNSCPSPAQAAGITYGVLAVPDEKTARLVRSYGVRHCFMVPQDIMEIDNVHAGGLRI